MQVVKMAIINNDTKTMRRVEEEEIEKYAALAKDRQTQRTP